MQKYLYTLLVMNAFTIAHYEGCAKPTEYVMQFLKKSGTKWKGDTNWKEQLVTIQKGQKIQTSFARTHLAEYVGVAATYFRLNEMGVKSSFVITPADNYFEIVSEIEEKEVKAPSEAELQEAKRFNRLHPNGLTDIQEDYCSKCEYQVQVAFDEKTGKLSSVSKAKCTSKIPKHLFKSEVVQ